MTDQSAGSRAPISPWRGLFVYWLLFALELGGQLALNGGSLCFTQDDPYIHLALAQNIWNHGHYGVNLGEYAAPSSSILWPFLVAPISGYPFAILGLNLIFGSATVVVLARCVSTWPTHLTGEARTQVLSAVHLGLLVATNQVGLAYLGMEHSLQVGCAILLAYGVLTVHWQDRWPAWFWPVACFSVLVRYEMLGLVAAVSVFAWMKGKRWPPLISFALIGTMLASFSWWLRSMGLGFLPSSIRAKVAKGPELSVVERVFAQLLSTLGHPQGVFMLCGVIWLLVEWRRRIRRGGAWISTKDSLAVALLVACLCHFAVGKYASFSRYEVYVWSFFVLLGGSLLVKRFPEQIQGWLERFGARGLGIRCALALMASCFLYFWVMLIGPVGSNNIYEQQYQMHRLVQQAAPLPVAVNDLGWVAYRNDAYVLDLWGLGSEQARKARFSSVRNSDWMETMAQAHDVGLIMVYDQWFETLPSSWQRMGELHLGKERFTPSHTSVVFYLRPSPNRDKICAAIESWKTGLPDGVEFQGSC